MQLKFRFRLALADDCYGPDSPQDRVFRLTVYAAKQTLEAQYRMTALGSKADDVFEIAQSA